MKAWRTVGSRGWGKKSGVGAVVRGEAGEESREDVEAMGGKLVGRKLGSGQRAGQQ